MMVKATDYYNLEKVAEVLSVSTAEVNRLREQNKLRGFRDGGNWKFLKEEVHTYLAAAIKARNGNGNGKRAGDSDFDLGGDLASSSSFDLLVEDAALPGESDLISVAPTKPKSDLDLAALDQDSDLALAEETQVSSFIPKKAKKAEESSSVAMEDSSSLLLDDSSALLEPDPEVHEVDFDDESVLEADGSSPQLGLAGESAFDVLVAADDSELLALDEEKTEISNLVQEFSLQPSAKKPGDDDSESSSQVIAIDVGIEVAGQDHDPFGGDNFDFGFDSDVQPAAPAAGVADPFGGVAASPIPDAFAAPAVSVTPKKAVAAEEEYSTGVMASLVAALVVMLLAGVMLIDTMVHLWSWGEPFVLNSMLMGTIGGLFGL